MKHPRLLIGALLSLAVFTLARAEDTQVYEMRTYYANPGKLDELEARFRDHTAGLFEKHGMTNVGYWTPVENEENALIYLMAYPSKEERETMWKAFFADPQWKAARAESEKDGKLLAKVESVFLTPTDYSPELKIEKDGEERLFELRTYTTEEGRLPALDARFRDHTVDLFGKHGMTNLIYFHLLEGQEGADRTLIYFLAHENQAARDASFDAFRQDADWVAARTASEADGPITAKGGVESVLLKPTDYSPLR